MPASLVVFDLDGTLIDSRRDLASSANELLRSRGAAALPEERIVRMVGDGARRLVERAFDAVALGEVADGDVADFLAIYDRRLLETTRPYDGVADLLAALAPRARLAVITNKPQVPARRLLEAFGVAGRFDAVLGGDGPHPRKPDPAALWFVMGECGAAAADTVLVGDSHVDLRTARAAGVQFCLAGYGFGVEQLPEGLLNAGDWVIHHPLELTARLPW